MLSNTYRAILGHERKWIFKTQLWGLVTNEDTYGIKLHLHESLGTASSF